VTTPKQVLHDDVNLHVASGAVLLGSTLQADYPLIAPLPSYGVGRDVPTDLRYRPLIFASNVTNFSLTGDGMDSGSLVDGQGESWWLKHFAKLLNYSRPRLVECMFCRDFRVADLTLQDSPFWTVHPCVHRGFDHGSYRALSFSLVCTWLRLRFSRVRVVCVGLYSVLVGQLTYV